MSHNGAKSEDPKSHTKINVFFFWSVHDILRSPLLPLLKMFLYLDMVKMSFWICFYLFRFVAICVFYGLSFYSAELTGNVYVNVFLICLVEIPGYITSYFMLNW